MDIFEFIQKFFLLLLPGIIGFYLYILLNIQKEEHYYLVFLKVIVISFVSYLCTDIVFAAVSSIIPCVNLNAIDIIHQIGANATTIPTANVLMSVLFALVLACLLTKVEYENWIFLIANKLHITRRTDNQTVWEHFLDENNVVILRDQVTKLSYYGKVHSYSDNSPNREIFFEDVAVFDKNSNRLYHMEKLYLSRAHNEFVLEVPDDLEIAQLEKKRSKNKYE